MESVSVVKMRLHPMRTRGCDMRTRRSPASILLSLCALVLSANCALAQSPGPQPLPMPAPIAAPRDTPYLAAIRLNVDATDVDRRIFRVRETIPVRAGGPLVLLYPQWLPGNHSPSGPVDKLAGLMIHANGARVEWVRDPVDVFAFHVAVPANATSLDVEFQFVSPVDTPEGRIVMTPDMLNLQWNDVVLYPAGYFARQIMMEPSVRLPDGWQFATALETASTTGGLTTFKPVSLDTVVDSPIFAGRYFTRLDLDPGGVAPVHLDIIADRADLLEVKPEQLEAHRALVQQAYKLYGSHHYNHYDLLLALSEHMGGIGLEHHQSSENGTVPAYFTEWDKNADSRDLLPHEFTHSWNGKFRRPADLWTPNFNVPMRDSLLWVYEGQTQYWGYVLAARAGLLTKQQTLDALAATAAAYDHRVGREWRALQDTTNDPIAAMRRALPWPSWERSEDYYSEGQLMWLDADTLIREKSGDRRSLDDFAKAFFGISDGSFVPSTYLFEDVVKALNSVQPYDWETFLRARLDGHGPGAPLDGLTRGGYKLVYTETPSDYFKAAETRRKATDLTYSLGMVLGADGRVNGVLWDGPAYKKGMTVGAQIVAVNGTAFDGDRLKSAISDAKQRGAINDAKQNASPIELLVKNSDRFRTVVLDYQDGLRYPHLERDGSAPARLDQILTPRK
jgi:predicted metalloprotease with PDZ domain